jgi:uncharacterized membrane protein (DUF106 family)
MIVSKRLTLTVEPQNGVRVTVAGLNGTLTDIIPLETVDDVVQFFKEAVATLKEAAKEAKKKKIEDVKAAITDLQAQLDELQQE